MPADQRRAARISPTPAADTVSAILGSRDGGPERLGEHSHGRLLLSSEGIGRHGKYPQPTLLLISSDARVLDWNNAHFGARRQGNRFRHGRDGATVGTAGRRATHSTRGMRRSAIERAA
jgi:hypothetical protein